MEAKDTVINDERLVRIDELLLHQAEISFKAGARKVVEWLEDNAFGLTKDDGTGIKAKLCVDWIDWQAFVKELEGK